MVPLDGVIPGPRISPHAHEGALNEGGPRTRRELLRIIKKIFFDRVSGCEQFPCTNKESRDEKKEEGDGGGSSSAREYATKIVGDELVGKRTASRA